MRYSIIQGCCVKELIREKVIETKKSLVLQKVSEYFEEVGFDNVKMQDIAEHTGLSVGALYNLFPSKDELFFEYIEYQIKRFHEELISASTGIDDPREALEKFVELKFSAFASKKEAIEHPVVGDPLFFLKMNTRKSEPAAPIYLYLSEIFARLDASEPLKNKDHLKTAYLFNAYTTGFIEYWLNSGGELDEDASEVVDIFLSGMRRGDG